MHLILDADGLIKLHRSGVLAHTVSAFRCTIPRAVYEEVVVRGKAKLHQDAERIERILDGAVAVESVEGRRRRDAGLGAGELAILGLLSKKPQAITVSDDRRFLAILTAQDAPFLTPADIIVVLARRSILKPEEAQAALERLKPAIRAAAYWEARHALESGGKGHEE